MRRQTLLFLALLLGLALALPGPALAKKKSGKKKAPEPETTEVQEAPKLMFEHVETKDFFGDLKVQRWTLPSNGLSVLLVPDAASPTFSYHTYYNVGSGDEKEGKTGLAHLFEHMMFKRTDKYDDQHFSRVLEEAGGPDLNAWTWLDITSYHVSLPKERLALIAELEATRMHRLEIDQAQLDAEREVVRNERRYRVDNEPTGAMNEKLWALAFEKTRYHWPTIGWDEDIVGYTVDDCMTFYRDYYAPNNATLVIAGDIEVEPTLRLLQEHYGAIPRSEPNRLPHGDEPEQKEARRLDMELDLETEMLQVGYKAPAFTHPDYPALMVLDSVLSAGNSSRLDRRLVDSGWASTASTFAPLFQHEALYEFNVSLRPGKAADGALEIIRREVADLREHLVSEHELEKARNLLLADQYGGLESNSGRAGFVGFNEVAAGSWEAGLTRIESIRAVTAEDVRRAAQTYLVDARSSVVVGRPKGKKLLTYSAKSLPKISKAAEPPPGVVDRPLEGPPGSAIGEVQEKQTGGWTRMLVYDPTTPMVRFRFVLRVGAGSDPEDKLGLTNLTAEMLLRGTLDRDRDAFERTLEGLGASVSASVGADTVQIAGSVLKENWPRVSNLMAEAFEFPAFREEDLKDLKEEVLADLVEMRNNDRYLARRFYGEALYGDHPYGRPVLGSEKTLKAIDREDLSVHYRRFFASRDGIFALIGDIDAGVGSDLAKVAGRLQGTGLPEDEHAIPADPEGRRLWLVDKPGRTQTQMYLGHFFPRMDSNKERYALAWLANEAFGGGGFSTRLMQQVREIRGWSYGAYASVSNYKDLSSYSMWVFPAMEQSADCLALVLELYEQFVASGLTEEELTYARSSLLNSAAFYTDTAGKRLNYEVQKKLTAYDPLSLLDTVRTATLEQVNGSLAAVYAPADLFIAVLGTADAEVPVGEAPEGGERERTTLKAALEGLVGADNLKVVPYDQD